MHSHIRRPIAPTLLLLLGISTLLSISPSALADDASDRAALEAAAQAWARAFNARDTDALVALATADVVLLDPNVAPLSGREAARGAWDQALAAAQGQVMSATKEVVVTGDVGWRIGALTHKLPNGDVLGRGQSLEIWRRVNGAWKIHRQMTSGILAPPNLLRRPPNEPVLDKAEQLDARAAGAVAVTRRSTAPRARDSDAE